METMTDRYIKVDDVGVSLSYKADGVHEYQLSWTFLDVAENWLAHLREKRWFTPGHEDRMLAAYYRHKNETE